MSSHYCIKCGESFCGSRHLDTPWHTGQELDWHHEVQPCCDEGDE